MTKKICDECNKEIPDNLWLVCDKAEVVAGAHEVIVKDLDLCRECLVKLLSFPHWSEPAGR